MKRKIIDHFSDNFQLFYQKYLPDLKCLGGKEYRATCPFHDDANPSLNITIQTGQYFCHGCNKKGDIFHFYGKINGLQTRNGFPKILKGIADDFGIQLEKLKPKLIKTYNYNDAEGNLISQTLRYEPKDFKQRRPDGKGRWIWKNVFKGIQPVLYRLPEVLKAKEIIIVEGEKDCDNLSELGFTATTCPMGAKKWRDDYNHSLKEKDVVLIPDNDNEGREHMTKVAMSLDGNVRSLKWLDLPDLPSKGDVSDFILIFADKDEAAERLSILIDQAEPYEPPKKVTLDNCILEIDQFCNLDVKVRYEYLSPWIKEGCIGLISGWRGIGKTFFIMGILNSISNGKSFGPWECKLSVPCLLLDGEMPREDIIERSHYLRLTSKRQNPLYIYSDAHSNQMGLPRAHLANESWREKMKQILIRRKIKLWAIDNLASLASGLDENSKKDWDPINQFLLELRFAGISTLMLHHVNKDGGQRGTSAREDNLDVSIMLKSPHNYAPEDGARFIVHFSKARVPTKHLNLISDTEFKITQDEHGKYVWIHCGVRQETRKEVLRLLDEGLSQTNVKNILGIHKGTVSKVRKKAIDEGFLTKNNKLTPSGFMIVNG